MLVLLGVGPVGLAVAREHGGRVAGTTRSPSRAESLRAAGIEPVVLPELTPEAVAPLVEGAGFVVSFPPDGQTDARVAPACAGAKGLVYISSTSVYGTTRGRVDDATPVAPADRTGALRLEAESSWLAAGAVVLRAPGIYGPDRGLHVRLRSGACRLAGDGSGVISRIHEDDLARLAVAAVRSGRRGETFVVGDLAPVPQIEAVAWMCERLGITVPIGVPLETVPATLRGDRAIDGRRALTELGVELRYPTWREGFVAALAVATAGRA